MRGFVLVVMLGACASSKPLAPEPAPDRIALDGAVIRSEPDPLTQLEAYDSDQLFHLAREAERNGKKDDARALYERLIQEFPESQQVPPARFNLGLLFEGQKAFADAAAQYRLIAGLPIPEEETARRTFLDAHYRLAVAHVELAQHWEAVAVFDKVLELDWLDAFDRLEALVGKGLCMRKADDVTGAEATLSAALRLYQDLQSEGPFVDNGLAAEAAFALGEIAYERYVTVELVFPIELLRTRLEEKCEHLLSAQHRFLRAIRLGDTHTVAAAGFRIGSLYESLYDAIVGLETPSELTEEEGEVYRDEVRMKVGVLVKKAIMVYERTLAVGRSAPTAQAWVGRIETALARLKALYLEDKAPPS